MGVDRIKHIEQGDRQIYSSVADKKKDLKLDDGINVGYEALNVSYVRSYLQIFIGQISA